MPARYYLAHIYLDLGRTERAREELEAALAQAPGNAQFLTLLGEVERQLKNLDRSLDVLKQALAIDPSSAQAHYYLGLTLLDLGQPAEAIKELERVVQGRREARGRVSQPRRRLSRCRAALDEGLEILSQATHIDPARPDIRIQLARAYRLKGMLDKAEAQLAIAAPQGPASVASPFVQQRQLEYQLYLEQGLLKLQQGQLEAAADAFRKVLEMDPESRADQPRPRRSLSASGREYARAREYATRAEKLGFPLSADKRKLLQDGLQKQKEGAASECGSRNELRWLAPLLLSLAALAGRTVGPGGQSPHRAAHAMFADVTAKSLVSPSSTSPAPLREKYMVETFGSGVAWIDYDNDGFQDLYFVNGAPGAANALYHNNNDGTFTDVTAQARVDGSGAGKAAYKTGVAVGDYDNDGYLDLYVTSLRPEHPLQEQRRRHVHRRDGRSRRRRAAPSEWSTSTGFLDFDRDGDLDLYVTNYLDFRLTDNPYCGLRKDGYRMYCHPTMFDGMADRLFRNNGNGTFTDVSQAGGHRQPGRQGPRRHVLRLRSRRRHRHLRRQRHGAELPLPQQRQRHVHRRGLRRRRRLRRQRQAAGRHGRRLRRRRRQWLPGSSSSPTSPKS